MLVNSMHDILRAGRNVWCERPVAACGLLVDGDDYYRAIYQAAQGAKRYIVLAGWQFDSDACLLRGEEAKRATLPVALLKYLDALCAKNEALHIYILAWDFHVVFSLERQWMQELRFKWLTSDRLQFRFDSSHVEGGSHHQKFVVIDGELSFLGGLDLCDHRWDDRRHCDPNPLRVSRGEPHKPFHDVQPTRWVARWVPSWLGCSTAAGKHLEAKHSTCPQAARPSRTSCRRAQCRSPRHASP